MKDTIYCVWTHHGAVDARPNGRPEIANDINLVTTRKTQSGATRLASKVKEEKGLEMAHARIWDDVAKAQHVRVRTEARRIPSLAAELNREINRYSEQSIFGGGEAPEIARKQKLAEAITNACAAAKAEPALWPFLCINMERAA